MALNNDQTQIRDYLLGKLSPEQQEKIEERLMVEDDLFDEFEVSKDELVENYCAGDLNDDEQHWFGSHYLASNEGRKRHALALAMECLQQPVPVPVRQVKQRPAFLESVQTFLRARPWAVATAASVALVVLVAILIFPPNRQPGTEITIERTLASNVLVRGDGGPLPTKIQLPANTAQVKLRLLLPQGAAKAARYRAVLDDRTNTIPVEVTDVGGEAVTVVIPRQKLPRGEYSLQLFAINAGGGERALPGYYLFNIE
jgi:hypothetical protein